MYSFGQLTFTVSYCAESVPAPLGCVQLAVPPEPPVPVPPLVTGTTLVTVRLNAPTVVAVLPAETWICMSTGVPMPTAFVHGFVVPAQVGQVTFAKSISPLQPLVKAGISWNGATAPEGGLALCVKPMRTTLPPLEPVIVIMKPFTGPA